MSWRNVMLCIGACFLATLGAQAQGKADLRLVLRVVPPSVQVVVVRAQPVELRAESRGLGWRLPISLIPSSGDLVLRLRKPGYRQQTVHIPARFLRLHPGDAVRWPRPRSEVVCLSPVVIRVTFRVRPVALVSTVGPDGPSVPLGTSDRALMIPLNAVYGDSAGPQFRVVLSRPGYHDKTVTLRPDARRWPVSGIARLKPEIPVLVPLIGWLAERRALSISLMLVLLACAGAVVRVMIGSRHAADKEA